LLQRAGEDILGGQILATGAMFASVTANPGTTCAARSANKPTAGNRASSATLSRSPASGAASGGSRR
jgi:2-keto-4-pentenoate hydratase